MWSYGHSWLIHLFFIQLSNIYYVLNYRLHITVGLRAEQCTKQMSSLLSWSLHCNMREEVDDKLVHTCMQSKRIERGWGCCLR